jgi:hypothetical protein
MSRLRHRRPLCRGAVLILALPLLAHAHEKADAAQKLRMKMLSALLSPAADAPLTDDETCKPAVPGATLREDVVFYLTAASERAYQKADSEAEGGVTHCRFTIGQVAGRGGEGWQRIYRFDLGGKGELLRRTLDCFTLP